MRLSRDETNVGIAILVLAAGASSRMGQSKQLLLIDGEPLLLRTIRASLQSKGAHTVVVLGAHAVKHEGVIGKNQVTVIVNEEWEKGMGSSLKTGLNHLIDTYADLRAVLVLVCDQPLLRAIHLDGIIDAYHRTQAPVVASYYAGSLGVPALFDCTVFPDLLRLEDSHGAKRVIEGYKTQVHVVDFPEGATDLDTMEEYLRFVNNN